MILRHTQSIRVGNETSNFFLVCHEFLCQMYDVYKLEKEHLTKTVLVIYSIPFCLCFYSAQKMSIFVTVLYCMIYVLYLKLQRTRTKKVHLLT